MTRTLLPMFVVCALWGFFPQVYDVRTIGGNSIVLFPLLGGSRLISCFIPLLPFLLPLGFIDHFRRGNVVISWIVTIPGVL